MKDQLVLEVAAGLRDLAAKNHTAQPDDLTQIADIIAELVAAETQDAPPPGPPFGDSVRPEPGVVAALEDVVLGNGGWVSTAEIRQQLGLSERDVRAAASEARVISSTSGGYRSIVTATDAEFKSAMNVLGARADAQLARRRWNIWVRKNENVFK